MPPPFAINIEKQTLNNEYYRKVIYTDTRIQIILMSLAKGEDIPQEIHDGTQFIRIESGKGLFRIESQDYILKDGDIITIPQGTLHYVKQIGDKPLKLYSIYSPPEHAPHTLQMQQPK